MVTQARPRFPLGNVVATPGALRAIANACQTPNEFIRRHALGDWGHVDADDAQANDDALRNGERLLSVYRTRLKERLWVITEADRASTCILLPDEY